MLKTKKTAATITFVAKTTRCPNTPREGRKCEASVDPMVPGTEGTSLALATELTHILVPPGEDEDDCPCSTLSTNTWKMMVRKVIPMQKISHKSTILK